jgi:hypothetical protein
MIRRPFLFTLFAFGAIAGFGSEIAGHAHHCWEQRRAAMLQTVAQTCAAAAKNPQSVPPAPPPAGW